ncbi:MAG TPA: hypothetical protein DEQ47_15680 [Solibacterales bacterium]|nr:hypothetical protein [Bryobacterales bacterium]
MTARELVMTFGWNATAYQILNPGIDHWFSSESPAVVGYTRRGKFLLAAGAPVCPMQALPRVTAEFEAFAAGLGCRVCYVCATERLRQLFAASSQHSTVAIGAEPVWDPRHWPAIVERHSSLRAQLNRARNKGVEVLPLDPREGRTDPELQRVLREWTGTRCLPPLHFLTEPETLQGEVADRMLLVARQQEKAVAFLVASPVPARQGYLVEQVARSPRAPNGTSELLIDAAMRQFAGQDRHYVTLGLVALSNHADRALAENPAWLSAMMRFARSYSNRFYNFQGLERFRGKMEPDAWEPVYAISNERRFSPFALYAIGEAFSGIAPWRAIALALGHAGRRELARLWPAK